MIVNARWNVAWGIAAVLWLIGCGGSTTPQQTTAVSRKTETPAPAVVTEKEPVSDEVALERAKLSIEDRALVDAQEWCVVNEEGRLGSMGTPVKLTIKGQAVFLCCAGCKRKAESNPDKTIVKLEELKSKAKSSKQKG